MHIIRKQRNSPLVSLAEAKEHLRVDGDADDLGILRLIDTATRHIEDYTGRTIPRSTITLEGPWVAVVKLPGPPVVSVRAVRVDGTTSLFRAVPSDGTVLVYPDSRGATMEIEYEAGWEEPPEPMAHAALLLVGHWYANREEVVTGTSSTQLPHGVAALLTPYERLRV